MYSVYICDDYTFDKGVLTIFNGKVVAKVKDLDGFHEVVNRLNFTAIVCPELLDYYEKVFITIFE